jgi:phosphoribosylformylglycinamidine synthase
VLEIWGAEYQEDDALLLRPEHETLFRDLCTREKVPVAFIGRVTGDGRVVLHDERDGSTPVNLDLEAILGDMPQKTFELERVQPELRPLELPDGLTVRGALDRVLRLLSVGSKRFLTTKVDRSVTGLVARQQCAGPLQLSHRAEPFRHHRRGYRDRRTADQGADRSGCHGPNVRWRGAHEPRVGAGEQAGGREVLR